ncbi:MAG TPA: SDR family oxidoreductase [Gaiellaceae bacterium]|jgi:NAD(P)-dependent dehydrogenase (short-subunit alcohol dehydrogenase family)
MTVALVTGSSRGVGQELARSLAEAGYDIALAARSDLSESARLVQGEGRRALELSLDVTDATGVGEAVARAESELGPLDLVVNNAGTDRALSPLWEADPEEWWADVDVHLRGTFLVCRAALPGMLERRSGRIVNVSSNAALRPSPYNSAYGAAKAAILNLTESLAASLEGSGVSVFAISPGYVKTAMTDRLLEAQEERGWFPHLVGRETLEPALAGQLVVKLASGRADRLSGRFFHALDDVDELIGRADEVVEGELYVARLRR